MSIILFNQVIDMLDIWIGKKLLFYIDHHSFHPYFDVSISQNVRSADSDEHLYVCLTIKVASYHTYSEVNSSLRFP